MNYQRMLSGALAGVSGRQQQLGKAQKPKKRYPLAQGETVVTELPDTMEGIEFQVMKMAEYVRKYSGHRDVIDFARALVRKARAQDLMDEVKKVYKFLLDHTRYVRDPVNRELIQTPELMVRDIIDLEGKTGHLAQGDCDELATFLATVLQAIGHKTRFIFGAFDRGWQHVWVQDTDANADKGGVMLDLAERLPVGKVLRFYSYGSYPIW